MWRKKFYSEKLRFTWFLNIYIYIYKGTATESADKYVFACMHFNIFISKDWVKTIKCDGETLSKGARKLTGFKTSKGLAFSNQMFCYTYVANNNIYTVLWLLVSGVLYSNQVISGEMYSNGLCVTVNFKLDRLYNIGICIQALNLYMYYRNGIHEYVLYCASTHI